MGKGFWEHMVADSTSWVQDSNERLKEYLEGSLSKAGLESFVTVMPRRDGYRIYAGEKPDAPFAYVDVYLDGSALVVEGSSKRHLSEQEMGDLARFLGISGSEAGEKLNRFRKFIDALQKHAGEDVDKLEDLKVSDACDKAAKGQEIAKAVSEAVISDGLEDPASDIVYFAKDGDVTYGDAYDIIDAYNIPSTSLVDGIIWVNEDWADPSDSNARVHLDLAVGNLAIQGDDAALDLYDSLSDDEVYEKFAVEDLVVQVILRDSDGNDKEYHEFLYTHPSHDLIRKVVRTVVFFSESQDSYKDTFAGLQNILPTAQVSDSVSVNFKNSKGGSAVRQLSGERVGKPVGKARPVRDSKASEVAKIDKALDLVRNAYKSTGKKSEVKGMSLDIKGLDDAVVDLKAYKSGKEDKIAVEIRWKDGERKGFDYGIDAKASHVYGDIVSLKKVADSLEDPTEDLIGVAKEGDVTYAEVESIFSSNGAEPSLDDRVLWVNYEWDDPADSKDEVHLALSSGLYSIHEDEVYARMSALPYNEFMQGIKVDYALVQVSLISKSTGADSEYKEFFYENPSKFTLDRISRVARGATLMAQSYEATAQLLEASLPKDGRVSDSVHVDIKNRKGGASVRQIDGSRISKPVAKARPVRDSKLVGQKVGKAAPKAKVRDFAAVPESALVPFQNAWAKLQSNSQLPKAKTSIDYMGELIPVELERKGTNAVYVRVNGKPVGSYDLKKDRADYVFNAIIGRDDTTVGDRVDKGLSKTSDAATGNSGVGMLELLSLLLLNDIDYTLQDDGSVDVDIPIGSGSDGTIAITLSGDAPDLNSALKGTVTDAKISVSVNGSDVRSWDVPFFDASKLKHALLDLHALSGSSSATVDEAITILDVAYEDFAVSPVADAAADGKIPAVGSKVKISGDPESPRFGEEGEVAATMKGRNGHFIVSVKFADGDMYGYNESEIVSDSVDFATRIAPQTKVYIKDFLTTDPYGHSGDAGVVLGRLDVDPDTVVVSFESGAPIALYDIDAIELDATTVSDSVEDAASLVASLESDSSLENQRRVADIMLKNGMHVLKDGRKEIMVIANADTAIPLFSFKQHAWTNIHDKALDSEKRSDFVFPADSSDVNDGKGHFPLNSLRRARAAIAYANKYQELPTWYSGDLDLKGFVDKIVSEVKKQYPSIEISPESYIPAPDQK